MAVPESSSAPVKARRDAVSDQLNTALPKFKPKSREIITKAFGSKEYRGRISPDDVRALTAAEAVDESRLMQQLTAVAAAYAYPPVSQFRVGSVCKGKSGAYYFGANIEIPGRPLGMSVHAEQASVANAYNHHEDGITALAVTAAPCGHCRQFLNELPGGDSLELLLPGDKRVPLARLLPDSFGPKELGQKGGPFGTARHPLVLSGEPDGEPVRSALAAAQLGYAPYSSAPSGVAIVTRSGGIYVGSYIENAAFNPSLPPLQSALVGFLFAGADFSDITSVVLCEVDDATISQKNTTADSVKRFAPEADMRHILAKRKPK